jgi:isocitrate lyase
MQIHLNIHNRSWHGFVAQQNMIVKKHHKTTSKKYIYLPVGWLLHYVQNLDHYQINQCMKKTVPALIKEI